MFGWTNSQYLIKVRPKCCLFCICNHVFVFLNNLFHISLQLICFMSFMSHCPRCSELHRSLFGTGTHVMQDNKIITCCNSPGISATCVMNTHNLKKCDHTGVGCMQVLKRYVKTVYTSELWLSDFVGVQEITNTSKLNFSLKSERF